MYRHEQSVRAFGVAVLVIGTAWACGMVVYHTMRGVPVGFGTYLGGPLALFLIVAGARYVIKAGLWRLTISSTDIAWTCPDFGDREVKLADVAHFSVRGFPGPVEGGDSTETWLVLKSGEQVRVPPNCLGDESKTWSALADVLPQRDE